MADDQLQSGSVSGIGGLLFKNPGYNSATIDQGTLDLINNQAEQAKSTSAQDYAQRDLVGTNQGIDSTGIQNFHTALGGPQDSNMQAALQARAQRSMDPGLNQLQRQAQVAGVGQQSHQMQNAFNYVTAQQKAQNDANRAQIQAYQNNQKARSSIISGLFGAAGTAAGFMGGGAGGAPGGDNMTMPDGSVAGSANNYGASDYSMPDMGSQFGGGGFSLGGP